MPGEHLVPSLNSESPVSGLKNLILFKFISIGNNFVILKRFFLYNIKTYLKIKKGKEAATKCRTL